MFGQFIKIENPHQDAKAKEGIKWVKSNNTSARGRKVVFLFS